MTAKHSQVWLVLTIAFLCVPGMALGQEVRGRIVGVVTDQSGAVVPGATVTATSPALIQPRMVVTADNGSYSFPSLPSGIYSVTFELAGFKTLRREQIRLTLDTTLTVDATVEVSTLSDAITVVGFGTFRTSQRRARVARNPRTGDSIKIPKRRAVRFTAGKAHKSAVR